jgi:hypothetical protein
MRVRGKRERVIGAIMTGLCNTSRDVAEETGLTVHESSKVVSALLADGVLRDTGRRMPAAYRNCKMIVFEVVR